MANRFWGKIIVLVVVAAALLVPAYYFRNNRPLLPQDASNSAQLNDETNSSSSAQPIPSPTVTPPAESETVPPTPTSPTTYTVKAGDTLYQVSRVTGLSLVRLMELNPWVAATPSLICIGDIFALVPGATSQPACPRVTPVIPSPTPSPGPTPSEISRGNTSRKQVIFTFDGGSGAQSAQAILNALSQYGVKGTFFMTGKFSEANPSLVQQIASSGHEIFNHTYSHPDLATVSDDIIAAELQREETINMGLTGKSTKPYFRPPYGSRNSRVLNAAWAQGYRSVYWTVDALDWQTTATDSFVYNRVMSNLSNGMIVLMHIGDDITGRILGPLFADIKSRGYSLVSLTQGL